MSLPQLHQVIEKHSKHYVMGDIFDSATQDEIISYFYYRHICDDEDKFIRFIHRNQKFYKNQYEQYLRIETTDFDPMVSKYLEQQQIGVINKRGTTNTDLGESTTKRKERELTEQESITTQNQGTGSSDNTRTLNTDGSSSYNDNSTSNGSTSDTRGSKNISSQFAQANMNNLSIDPSVVDVDYATSSVNAKEVGSGTSQDTSNGYGSGTTQERGIITDEGDSSFTENGNANKQNTKGGFETESTTKAGGSTTTESGNENINNTLRYTGRDGYTPADMLERARNYISTTNAFMWLVNKLEICFMGNLRYEEEE